MFKCMFSLIIFFCIYLVEDINKRFSTMRATFFHNYRKTKSVEGFVPKWSLYKKLMFLLEDEPSSIFNSTITQQSTKSIFTSAINLQLSSTCTSSITPSCSTPSSNSNSFMAPSPGTSSSSVSDMEVTPVAVAAVAIEPLETEKPKWTVDLEAILIDFYSHHPELWNHKLEDYKTAGKSSLMDLLGDCLGRKFSRKFFFCTLPACDHKSLFL